MNTAHVKFDAVASCIADESFSWAAFVEEFGPVIRRAVVCTLQWNGNSVAGLGVEDVIQEVYCRLIGRDGQLLRSHDPARGTMATWLTIVARSTALDCLRQRRLERIVPYSDQEHSDALWTLPAPLEADRLQLPAGVLSKRQEIVMELLFAKDMDVDEAAAMLDVHPKTVRSIKATSLARLRHYYCAVM